MDEPVTNTATDPQPAAPRKPRRVVKSRLQRRVTRAPARVEEPPEAQRDEVRTQGPRLERTRKRTDDRFFIDKRIIPKGQTYEWKRESVYGRSDPHHINQLKDNHWTEVPEGRHKGLITRQDGMILMERPDYLTMDAKREDYMIAQDQVRGVAHRISETPHGTMTRDHPSVRANTKLNREYIPMDVPSE